MVKPGPRPFLTIIASVLIVLVTAIVVSAILDDGGGEAPGLRTFSGRPSVLQNAGYVVNRTTGPKIERY